MLFFFGILWRSARESIPGKDYGHPPEADYVGCRIMNVFIQRKEVADFFFPPCPGCLLTAFNSGASFGLAIGMV